MSSPSARPLQGRSNSRGERASVGCMGRRTADIWVRMDERRLPIPPLEDTMKRYLDALEGLQVSAVTMHARSAGN